MAPSMDDQGNVFLTWENLAFSMPLLLTCGVYAFFKFIPTPIALGLVALGVIVYQIRVQMIKKKHQRLEKMDDSAIQELLEQEEEEKKNSSSLSKKEQAALKKKKAVQNRLLQEQKKKNKNTKAIDEDDDDVDLSNFVKKKK